MFAWIAGRSWLLSADALIPDPQPDAPAEVKKTVGHAFALAKYGSLISVGLVLALAGTMVWAGEHGHGQGLTPELKRKLTASAIALTLVGGAVQLIDFFRN